MCDDLNSIFEGILKEIKEELNKIYERSGLNIEKVKTDFKGLFVRGGQGIVIDAANPDSSIDLFISSLPDDVGRLEIILFRLSKREPLSFISEFNKYNYLLWGYAVIGCFPLRLHYRGSIDLSFITSEVIGSSNRNFIDKVSEQKIAGIIVGKSIIYPKGGIFTNKQLNEILSIYKEV